MKAPPKFLLGIGLLIGVVLILVACNLALDKVMPSPGKAAREEAAIKDIQLSIKNFQVEYNAYPLPQGHPTSQDFEGETTGPLLDCLLGQHVWGNEREIQFIEPPIGKDSVRGLIGEPGSYRLVDTWGHPYRVWMDANNDHHLANPDLKNSDSELKRVALESLPYGVAVFSCGPDGLPYTADDLPSWRQGPMPPEPRAQYLVPVFVVCFAVLLIAYCLCALRRASQQRFTFPAPL